MDKVSAEQIVELLGHIPEVIRNLTVDRDFWMKEAQVRIRRDEAEKVAHAMHDKGIEMDTPFDVLVERMEKAAEQGQLENIERAVDYVGPDMGRKFAQLTNDDRVAAGPGADPLTQYLVGGIG